MKTLACILAFSSLAIVGLANLPKKPLPPIPAVPKSVPSSIKAEQVKAEQVKPPQAGTWYHVELCATKSGFMAFTAIIKPVLPPAKFDIYQGWFCTRSSAGPFPTPQATADAIGSIWLGNGPGGHIQASVGLILSPTNIGPN